MISPSFCLSKSPNKSHSPLLNTQVLTVFIKKLTVNWLQEPLPNDPAWWELFKVSKEDMYTVARQVHALFSMPKVQYISAYRITKPEESKDSHTAPILVSHLLIVLILHA